MFKGLGIFLLTILLATLVGITIGIAWTVHEVNNLVDDVQELKKSAEKTLAQAKEIRDGIYNSYNKLKDIELNSIAQGAKDRLGRLDTVLLLQDVQDLKRKVSPCEK